MFRFEGQRGALARLHGMGGPWGSAAEALSALRREAARAAGPLRRALRILRGWRLGALALLALALSACPPPGPPVRYGRSRDCRAILARAGVSNPSAHCGAARVRVERGRFPR